MKVLYWAEGFFPNIGGLEVLSAQFLSALQARGHEFVVIASDINPNLPERSYHDGIPVYRFPFFHVLTERDLNGLRSVVGKILDLIQSFKPDLIHVNYTGPSLFFLLRARTAMSIPTLFAIHSPPSRTSGANGQLAQMLRAVDWVAAVSHATLCDAEQVAPEIAGRTSVIHNGLKMPILQPTSLAFDSPRLLFIGRLAEEKGVDVALDAFALLLRRFSNARLMIAGDGPVRWDLEQHASLRGLNHAVQFLGWVSPEKIPALINSATMVVMPSRWREPFGLVALQAAQMARPIVATRVGALPEIILHNETGVLVENEDSGALADSIAFLLEHPAAAVKMGQAARKRAQETFGFERFVHSYEALYHDLFNDHYARATG